MTRRLLRPAVVAAALCAAVSGCRMAGAASERDDLDSACRAAVELRLTPRTFELLSRAADQVVGHERQLVRLEAAAREDLGRFGAADDPRFVWAHEMEICVRLMLAAGDAPTADPEPSVRAAAWLLLEFEQAAAWARFAACRERSRDDAEFEAALLNLRISTGWEDERIFGFSFDSLPTPGDGDSEYRFEFPERDTTERGVETVRATAALLTLAATSPTPERAKFDAALERLEAARRALAESYLRRAERRLESERSDAALAAWRIARARCELERSFPGF